MVKPLLTPNRAPSQNGATPAALAPPASPLFTAEGIKMQRRMRVNPLPRLNPEMLGITLDQFEYGMLREACLLWEAMVKRDDTLVTVKPQLENEVASQDWGVHLVADADPAEAARHKACLDYFYDHLIASDAYDRNVRGGLDKLIEQMMSADSFFYSAHHIVWRPQPGKTVPVSAVKSEIRNLSAEASAKEDPPSSQSAVPVITAEIEHVPLWFFENTSGRLRFLKDGGFGVEGEPLEKYGDWIVVTGRGLMFAASICVTFKRLTFQDWTIFNERYAQNKVVGTTPAAQSSPQGLALRSMLDDFNADQGLAFYEFSGDPAKPPISLLGPQGTATIEIFKEFIERQDAKMSSMYRGNDLSMMSRGGERGEKRLGASLQEDEGDAMVRGCCRRIVDALHENLTRQVIELCFGVGVEPLAYLGQPDLEKEDTADLRESAEFLVTHGARVPTADMAERLGVQLAPEGTPDDELLETAEPAIDLATASSSDGEPGNPTRARARDRDRSTANVAADMERFLGTLVPEFKKAFADDLIPLRLALEHVAKANGPDFTANVAALQFQLPSILRQILATNLRTPSVLAEIMQKAFELGTEENLT